MVCEGRRWQLMQTPQTKHIGDQWSSQWVAMELMLSGNCGRANAYEYQAELTKIHTSEVEKFKFC